MRHTHRLEAICLCEQCAGEVLDSYVNKDIRDRAVWLRILVAYLEVPCRIRTDAKTMFRPIPDYRNFSHQIELA